MKEATLSQAEPYEALAAYAEECRTSRNKIDTVFNAIKNTLLNNQIPCGTEMSERKIGEVLQVSRSPVREGLKLLCSEGLLMKNQSEIIVVPDITWEHTVELYDLLEVIDVYVMQKSVRQTDEDFVRRLLNHLERYERAVWSGAVREAIWADYDFHNELIRQAIPRSLEPLVFPLNGQRVRNMNAMIGNETHILSELLAQHKKMFDAIVAGDLTAASQEARAHIYSVKSFYKNRLQKED